MRYNVYNYEDQDMPILEDVPMLVLVQHDFVKTDRMQDAVIALDVGGDQLSDNGTCFIRRIS